MTVARFLGDKRTWNWYLHALREKPLLAARCSASYLSSRVSPQKHDKQLVILTHHKVLSTFLSRVMNGYAACTHHTISRRRPGHGDYSADIIFDNHSRIDVSRLRSGAVGLHVYRDPRDLVVSAAFYHQRSDEKWLHIAQDRFGGLTYQQKINSLPDMTARIIFEIDNSAGENIADMLLWGGHPGIVEVDYKQLTGPRALERFTEIVEGWGLSGRNKARMLDLFEFFSLGGAGSKNLTHIRDPRPDQWRAHFTPLATDHFIAKFPQTRDTLGW